MVKIIIEENQSGQRLDRFTSRKPDMMDGEEAVEYAFPHRKKEEKKQAEQDSERP